MQYTKHRFFYARKVFQECFERNFNSSLSMGMYIPPYEEGLKYFKANLQLL